MVAAEQLLVLILLSYFLTARTSVEGSRETCPNEAIVDLTGEEPDDSGSINKTGIIFTRNATWEENDRTFGCPCDLKKCIPFCCLPGYALSKHGCLEDKFSTEFSNLEHGDKNFHGFVSDPCNITSTGPASWGKYYTSLKDGLLDLENRVDPSSRRYCLVRGVYSPTYWIGDCDVSRFDALAIWYLSCLGFSLLFGVATFFVYSVKPELKNLQGSIFRSYLGSYIGCIFLYMTCLVLYRFPQLDRRILDFTIAIELHYLGTACMFWLNVMSFDIWQKFRKFQSIRDVNIKKLDRAKFIRYSIYAWGVSVVPVCSTWSYLKLILTASIHMLVFLVLWPIVCIGICNICLFTLTALKIRQRKKETQHMVDGVNKHQKQNEQWFNLYVKLFIIMGGPLIIWIASFFLHSRIFTFCVNALNVLQGISICLIFVWKDDVKRSFGKRFNEMMLCLGSCLRRGSTSTTEN